ncbi:hypothetical protein HK097_004846 [Rhizophlyctis rosea]|uniref:histidine kinase n=1 Tax=Rhizophlyctis rosea TaxID=64517 RepID=A0AAD5SEM1_9FUNG|nr:hypothetical protein HK097_004846 [Rhizophlyctis rosea]
MPITELAEKDKASGGLGSVRTARLALKQNLGYTLRAIDELQCGDHICFLYENAEEHRSVTTTFVRGGVQANHKIVYIGDSITKSLVLAYFNNSSIDIQALIAKGQFEFLTYDSAYVVDGNFSPEAMVKLLKQTVDDATSRGFAGERVMGEMTWILKHLKNFDEVVRYESMVNKVFEENNALAVCQYNRHMFDAQLLLNVINVHPLACVGMELYDNFYYIPADEWASEDKPSVFLRYWLRNLRDRKKVEEDLNQAKEVALAECKAKTEFLNSMSHEIRTPLNGLIGTAQILKETIVNQPPEGPPPDSPPALVKSLSSMSLGSAPNAANPPESSVQSLLQTMEVCSNHLLSVVNDVLDLSRIPHSVPEGQTFSFFRCLDESIQITSPRAKSKNVALSSHVDPAVQHILGPKGAIIADESGLRKVLINLLGNGAKFTNPAGEVRVEVGTGAKSMVPKEILAKGSYTTCPFTLASGQSEGSSSSSRSSSQERLNGERRDEDETLYTRLHFTVRDTGIGIPSDQVPRIFKAFSRVEDARDSSDKPIEGTGLGLVISKQLVVRMGGDMWVESDGIGKGTRFQFWVWVKRAPPGKVDEEEHRDSTSEPISSGSGSSIQSIGLSSSASPIETESGSEGGSSESSPRPSSTDPSNKPRKPKLIWHNGGEYRPELRILIVDDNSINRRILYQFLTSFKYKHIAQSEDGVSALSYIRSLLPEHPTSLKSIPPNLPSVVLLDYKMPVLTGAQTAREIRSIYASHGLPQPFMACLTAAVLEDEMKECVESGIEEVMIKPLRWAEVGEKVWRWGGGSTNRWKSWEDERAAGVVD